jgi:hypothetical protein
MKTGRPIQIVNIFLFYNSLFSPSSTGRRRKFKIVSRSNIFIPAVEGEGERHCLKGLLYFE